MGRLFKGVMVPGQDPRLPKSRLLNVGSKKRTEPLVHSNLDGLLTKTTPKICVYRRLGGIGDVIMSTTMLKHIKRLLPNCHLVYATDLTTGGGVLADCVRNNPFIDELVDFRNITARDYDLFTDITATGLSLEKSGKFPPNRIELFASQIGLDISSDPLPVYIVTEDEQEWAQKRVEEYCVPAKREEVTVVGIQIQSNDHRRSWPADHSEALITLLTKDPKFRVIAFTWNDDKRWHKPQTYVCGESLRYTAALVNECDVIVCPDSGILHLAGAMQKKIVSLFGSVPPQSRINFYQNATAITAGLPCCCWYSNKCGNKITCMQEIKPEVVYGAVINKLSEDEKVQQVIQTNAGTEMKPQNAILIKRHLGGFGDILMTLPAVEALKKKYPTKKIYYAVPEKFKDAVLNNPIIDEVMNADLQIRNNQYSIVIDITSPCANYECKQLREKKKVIKSRVEVFAESLGVKSYLPNLIPKYYPTEEELSWAKTFIGEADKPKLAVALRSAEEYRSWPIEHYQKLFETLSDYFKIIILDVSREFSFPNTVDGCGFGFRKSAALVAISDMLLTPDTGTLHIGAALNIPTVALFGPIDPAARCKGYNNIKILTSSDGCVPCWRNADMSCKKSKQIKGYSECMKNLSVSAVCQAILDLQKEKNKC